MVVFLVLFPLIFLFLTLELLNVLVPNLPLSDLTPQVIRDWRLGGSTFLLDVGVYGLHLAALVVELVAHGLLDGFDVLS